MFRPLSFLAGVVVGGALAEERRVRRRAERFSAAALESLLRAVDANDPETGRHVRRAAEDALIIARAAGLGDQERRTVELAALFHDVGKIDNAVNDLIVLPRKLSPDERRKVMTHPERGAAVLAPVAHFHPDLAEAVLSHHERWNGSGYPRGLRGTQIPLAARIVALADTFDAITHRRHYRGGRTPADAARIIRSGRGTEFDPQLVDLMLSPPVFAQLVAADKAQHTYNHRDRRDELPIGDMPSVRIRWRDEKPMPEVRSAARPGAAAAARSAADT
ncbi:MAG TPA: HD domain-containing phosphohydrolase [Gemmatimonadaceae bacterium]|nr:HD domain-containing phosphohydrolase [Gemmatimonadaceae bacterium]